MKTVLKRIVIHLYCRDWISATTTARLFTRLSLRRA
jgi:hypothetical protein